MFGHKKHLFFDLDDTVTLSRSRIDDDMHECMRSLPHDLVIISGARADQIRAQVGDLNLYVLGQNGNEAFQTDQSELWREVLSPTHEAFIREHIEQLRSVTEHAVIDHNDLVEHRGAQISYSLIGHHEDVTRKKAFDPDRAKRLALLSQVPFENDEVEVRIGGTTCFDYFLKGKHKGHNVARLIQDRGWDKDACLYFGDALFPGGNDEAVIGVIDTVPVTDHRDTFAKLTQFFGEQLKEQE